MPRTKMICPDCGVEMNYHAEKIDYNITDPSQMDPALGGIVEEVHTCPLCGRTHTRPSQG